MTTTQIKDKPAFFISRAGADRELAIAIAGILHAAGCRTWLQDENFSHASFMARMAQGFASENRMIALLSQAYQQSEHCKKEYEQILSDDPRNLKERLLVFRIEDVAPIEHLKELAYTDLVPLLSDATALARIVRVAVGVEKRQAECDYAALYQRAPQPIVHPEIEAIRGFIGRDNELEAISSALRESNDTASTLALTDTGTTAVTGMGGVGKTLLAKQYAWQHREDYPGLWWARGERRQTLVDDLVELGARLIPGLAEMPDQETAAQATLDRLAYVGAQEYPGAKPWLLIYDNVETPDVIQGLTPQQGVSLLITSRWSDWHGYAEGLVVDAFPPETAVEFLLAHARNQDADGAARLAEDLGYLPLALEQARSYCWRTHLDFEQYRTRLPELIKKMPRQARYPEPVFATFDLALAQASASEPAAEPLMLALSFLAPDAIPMSLVAAIMPEDAQREEAIGALSDLSLLNYGKLDDGTPSINIHRLVQEVAHGRLEEEHPKAFSQDLETVLTRWPSGNDGGHPKYWPVCRQLSPHALALLDRFEAIEVDLKKIARLKNLVAYYLSAIGRYKEAEPLVRKTLEINQRVLGEDHPDTAASYNNLAYNLKTQGRYEEAEPLYRNALEICQRVLGEDHPDTATSYNNLAYNLHAQGRYEEAEPLNRQALEIRQRGLGEDHPDTATSYNNLAYNLKTQGRYEEAEPLVHQALEICQRVLGEDHPDTAASYNNLAFSLDYHGRHEEAEPLVRNALEIRQRVLGEDHPDTAASYNNVAYNLSAQGRYEEAEPLYHKALEIMRATLPPTHPSIETVQKNLNNLLANMEQ
ncbi:MAG: hypothetical protein DBP03_18505 [gamma proteobacterium symbiont of Ctena orbiculata]|nr:MAG: hypothetical protein DBP03_18505 [gamma proteobacterium symbiont of Ctena orbiculata]